MRKKREGGLPDLPALAGGFDGGGAELEVAMQVDLSVMYANHYKRAIRPAARVPEVQNIYL
jgi:hypothetical protein